MTEPTRERLMALDVLRGAALFGVLLVNLEFWFRTTPLRYELERFPFTGWGDQVVDVLLPWLFARRFMGLFAFLFGAGLAMQAERSSRGFLLKRLAVLGLFGALHVLLLWSGDILHLYAVVGVVLVFAAVGRTPARLFQVLLVLMALPLVVGSVVLMVRGAPTPAPSSPAGVSAAIDAVVRGYRAGDWSTVAATRLAEYVAFLPIRLAAAGQSLVCACLGVAAWKSGALRAPSPALLRRCLVFGGVLGLGQPAALLALEGRPGWDAARLLLRNASGFAQLGGVVAYAAAVLWLLERPGPRRVLAPLASVGRMALTNYLLQSVCCSIFFFGFGFYDRLGPMVGAVLACGLYAAQVVGSELWLRRFQFGPVEWLWRSLTYGRRQPFAQSRVA